MVSTLFLIWHDHQQCHSPNCICSVGVLIRAKQLGYIPAIKPYLQQLKQSGIYFSERFLKVVLDQTGEL